MKRTQQPQKNSNASKMIDIIINSEFFSESKW